MDFKDPTLRQIKQENECEDVYEDTPDFIKVEPVEIKDVVLTKSEFVCTGNSLPNTDIKQEQDIAIKHEIGIIVKEETDTDIKQQADIHIKQDSNIDIKQEANIHIKQESNIDVKQEYEIDIQEHALKTEEVMIKSEQYEDWDDNSIDMNGQDDTPNKKSFSCDLCGEICRNNDSYALHMMDHSGERPFKCKKCAKAFKSGKEMIYHMKTHADSSDSSVSGLGSSNHSGSDSDLMLSLEKEDVELDEQSKQICLNVYKNLQVQNNFGDYANALIEETASLTGVPYSTISQIIERSRAKRKRKSCLNRSRQKN